MKRILSIIIIIFFFLTISPVSAQILNNSAGIVSITDEVQKSAGFNNLSIGNIAAGVISAVLGLLAIIFLILTILAGFRWMTAAGNEEKVRTAQETIKTTIIGLIIILAAYAITYFIFKYLPFSGTGGSTGAV